MNEVPIAIQVTLCTLVIVAAVYDVRFRRIPNWLVLTGFCGGIALQGVLRGWSGLRDSALGAVLAFGVYFVFFALRAMGGGDVKLMTAIGAMVGPANWLVIFLCASILGGVLAVILILLRGRLVRTLRNVFFILSRLARFEPPFQSNPELDVSHPDAITLPHGLSIAIGCMVYLALADLQI